MLHLIARRGNSALLTLVTQVADDIRSTRANTGLSSLDMMRSGSSSSSLATAMHPACSMQSHTTNQAKHVKSLFACFGGRKKVCRQASVETTEPLMDVIVNAANAKGVYGAGCFDANIRQQAAQPGPHICAMQLAQCLTQFS